MSTFTKLNVNGEVREVAAIYDGSGNTIVDTYETITKVTEKETALSTRITSVHEALEALTLRVAATEAFDTRITKNAEDIATNSAAIAALQGVDTGYRTELDTLTIKVGEATTSATNANNSLGSLSLSIMTNSNKITALEALVNDEAQGINALNTQADKNTGDIAKVAEDLGVVQTAVAGKVSNDVFLPVSSKVDTTATELAALQETVAALLARIEALETPANTPDETPEDEPAAEPTDPEADP